MGLSRSIQKFYVQFMMDVIGRGLVVASQVDQEIQKELKAFPKDFSISMQIFGDATAFYIKVNKKQQFDLIQEKHHHLDLTITFKHLQHAFSVFSFQESTAQAFAHNRMIADGDLSHAIRLVRCLNRMETLILPKYLAKLAVKEYPTHLTFKSKIKKAQQIYLKLALSFLKGKQSHD